MNISEIFKNVNQQSCFFLIKGLGYKTNPKLLDISQFGLPSSAQRLISEFHIISDYEQKFQIYFVKTSSMRRGDFRTILEPFYRRFPQLNTLFIFTQDFSEIGFVSPERVAISPKEVRLLLRILFLDPKNVYHTDEEVINSLAISAGEQIPEIIWQKHKSAFNVERVTKEFFEAYKNALNIIKGILSAQGKGTFQQCHSFAQQFLSRIMFLYYIQKKGWLKWKDYRQDKRYIKNLWQNYNNSKQKKDTFYSTWLSSLFFSAFNRKHEHLKEALPEEIKESFTLMPFLNGGLFTKNDLDEIGFNVPDEIFKLLFELDPFDKKKGFLERYNFTIREDTPQEVEVAVDPEMLGKVYESLISEEERGKAGIFYTPRTEIDYMCRMSLVEYLAEETKISKTDIILFVFDPQKGIENISKDSGWRIKSALDKVKIVDPAVGSASFLVGMMNVLVELHRHLTMHLENKEENLFALKQKIIQENLYGVDVKDWAVMVGELRLWLSLIIETEEKYMDIYTKPLLPNLSFKMRQGDSLVEEIAGIPISLRGRFAYIPEKIKEKITELKDRKAEFFSGRRSADLKEKEEIENLENDILKGIIGAEIQKLQTEAHRIKSLLESPKQKQTGIFRERLEERSVLEAEIEKQKNRLQEIKIEILHLENALKSLGTKARKDYFLWEIDFAEVFAERDGFDIVIGNPPYVRQEMIAFPLEREEDYSAQEWRERKQLYKEKLAQFVNTHWQNVKIDKRSDLYVYFYYQGLALLRPGGVFCFINSNSWLDVGYGAGLQGFLLKNMQPLYIVDNIIKRSFAESDVNTVIVLIKRPSEGISESDTLKFIAFKKPFEDVIKTDTLLKIEQTNEKLFTDDFRVFPKTRKELLEEGLEVSEESLIKDPMNLPYIGNKWGGKYLRAPEIYFKILEKGKGKLVRLGDIAEVRRGFTTGANEFFYLEPTGKPAPKGLLHVKNGAGWEGFIEEEFLKPVIKSPRELKSIIVKPEDLRYKVFMCHKSKAELKGSYALEYINWGEKQKTKGWQKKQEEGLVFIKIRSFKGRSCWYSLNVKIKPASIFWWKIFGERHSVFLKIEPSLADQTFYLVYPDSQVNQERLVLSLNSVTQRLFNEIFGIEQTGAYAVTEMTVEQVESALCLNPIVIQEGKFKNIPSLSIFVELGFTLCHIRGCTHPEHPYEFVKPEEVSFDKVMPDRRELDKIVFEALGLTEEEQLEVYRAVVELVKNRLVKARSV